MAFKITRALALTTALGAAGLAGAAAIAQTSPSQPPVASPSAPPQSAPDAGQPGPMGPGGMGSMGPGGMGPGGMGPGGMGQGGMGHGGMGQGYGYGYGRGYGYGGYGYGEGRRGGRQSALSAQDREAMVAAHLAAVRAGLLLTPDQERLWPAVENAAREGMKLREDWRARMDREGVAASPVERMRRMGEMATARGAAMTRFADAATPLYNSLSDDQKRRLQMLGGHGMGRMMGMMGGEGRRGDGMGRHGMGHHGMGHYGMGHHGMGHHGMGGRHHHEGRDHQHDWRREGGRL